MITAFEELIRDLGAEMGLNLKPDARQSCLLTFRESGVRVQIDLGADADQILVGSELGTVPVGAYRERVLKQAMRVNGLSQIPRGILAYSEKNNSLVLFQFLPLASLNGKKLFNFLQLFLEHARVWIEAIKKGEIPPLQEDLPQSGGFLGLKK